MAEDSAKLPYHYIKITDLQTRFATGAIGGITPNAHINLDLFVDRVVIPQKVTYEVDMPTQKLIEPPYESISREGIVREVHTSLIFDVGTAKSIVDWLQKHIQTIEEHTIKL